MITVVKAPGFLTIQDLGWAHGRAWGLPRSGAMDPVALRIANLLVGNSPSDAGLEWALGPGLLRVERNTLLAFTGAEAEVLLDQTRVRQNATVRVRAGQTLRVRQLTGERFLYVAVQGGIAVPEVVGSRSTYLPAGLGGLGGRRLEGGDTIPVGEAEERRAPAPGFRLALPPRPPDPTPFAILAGPQAALFNERARELLTRETYTISPASDRMGIRLVGPGLAAEAPATLPSEGACPGAVQVPDSGQPIVLLADGPTVGGYPKVAVVASFDLPRLAQQPLGSGIRFRWVTLEQAVAEIRRQEGLLRQIERAVRLGERLSER